MDLTLRGVNLNNSNGVEKLTEAICRMLFCAGLFGWAFRSVGGKRKGYGLLVFSATCAVLSFVFVYNFREGLAIGRQQRHESNQQFASAVYSLMQQMTNAGEIKLLGSTGDNETDAAMVPLIDYLNNFKSGLETMNAELAEQLDVFSPFVLTNRSAIEAEIGKRTANQATIQKCQKDLALATDTARVKFRYIKISEDAKQSALLGFDNLVKGHIPALNEMFSIRLRRQKAESDFFQFLFAQFDRYHVAGSSIAFDIPHEQQEYERLSGILAVITKDAEAFQNRENEAVEAAKHKVEKIQNE